MFCINECFIPKWLYYGSINHGGSIKINLREKVDEMVGVSCWFWHESDVVECTVTCPGTECSARGLLAMEIFDFEEPQLLSKLEDIYGLSNR